MIRWIITATGLYVAQAFDSSVMKKSHVTGWLQVASQEDGAKSNDPVDHYCDGPVSRAGVRFLRNEKNHVITWLQVASQGIEP
jgi:hypothetical protein